MEQSCFYATKDDADTKRHRGGYHHGVRRACAISLRTGDGERCRKRMLNWAEQCQGSQNERQALFGIVQEACLRNSVLSAPKARRNGFEGYSIGGLSVGEGAHLMNEVLDYTVDYLPQDRPRYLMGVGFPSDILDAVERVLICLIVSFLQEMEEMDAFTRAVR